MYMMLQIHIQKTEKKMKRLISIWISYEGDSGKKEITKFESVRKLYT